MPWSTTPASYWPFPSLLLHRKETSILFKLVFVWVPCDLQSKTNSNWKSSWERVDRNRKAEGNEGQPDESGRADAEAEAPILWPPDVKNWLIGKDPDSGKDWRQEEKGVTEDKMVGWHYWFNGHEFEQTLGDSEGRGSLRAAVGGCKESDTT